MTDLRELPGSLAGETKSSYERTPNEYRYRLGPQGAKFDHSAQREHIKPQTK